MSSLGRIQELKSDIAELERELKAKDAILTEAIRSYSGLPPHPENYALIENVLGVSLKHKSSTDTAFQCFLDSSFLYEDFLCVSVNLQNNSSFRAVLSGAHICSCLESGVYSEATAVIFDGLTPVKLVECDSERKLYVSCSKSMLLEKELLVVVDFHMVDLESSIDPRLLLFLPSLPATDHMRKTFSFRVMNPKKILSTEFVSELSIDEGLIFYQNVYVTHASHAVDFNASQLSGALRPLNTFEAVDFGDWLLMVGTGLHSGLFALCLPSSFSQVYSEKLVLSNESLSHRIWFSGGNFLF